VPYFRRVAAAHQVRIQSPSVPLHQT
jgi:hypothetical protein